VILRKCDKILKNFLRGRHKANGTGVLISP